MCGITGFSNFKKNIMGEFERVVLMNESLTHRGPDSSGYYKHNHVLFGHKRLSIVDPSGGVQPMSRVIGGFKYTIVYNGEIYNTEIIRKNLIEKGYEFSSYSDTEVVLISYIFYKEKCVEYLNGIFAFSIFDERRNCVFMARDHLGVKPLFYSIKDNYLIFSSEIKAMLKHPLISSKVSKEGILDLLSLGPSRSPGEGIFKDIKEVPPAHYLWFFEDKVILKEYWKLHAREHRLNEKVSRFRINFYDRKCYKKSNGF